MAAMSKNEGAKVGGFSKRELARQHVLREAAVCCSVLHPNVVATYHYEVLHAASFHDTPTGLSITDVSGEKAFKLYLIQVVGYLGGQRAAGVCAIILIPESQSLNSNQPHDMGFSGVLGLKRMPKPQPLDMLGFSGVLGLKRMPKPQPLDTLGFSGVLGLKLMPKPQPLDMLGFSGVLGLKRMPKPQPLDMLGFKA